MKQHFVPTVTGALFAIEHYLALVILGVIAFAIGRRLTARVVYHNTLEMISFSIALGLGAISFLILLLGVFRLLYPTVLLAALAVCLILSKRVFVDWYQYLRKHWPPDISRVSRTGLFIAVLLVLSAPFFIRPLYPAIEWDSTQYHLAAAKIYVQHHAVVFTPYLRYPVFPQTNQMLFTGALLVYDEILAHQIQFLMLVTLAVALIGFGKRYFNSRTGWWAAAALLASPLVILLGSIAYADVGLMLFVFLSAYAFWNWGQQRASIWLILAGIFSGLAFGSKYTAAFFPLIFCLSLIWSGWKERKFSPPLILGGVALLVAAPWLWRGIYYTGNPLFPFFEDFFTGIFGERQVEAAGFRGQVGASLGIGTGRSLASLVKLPLNLIFNQKLFLPEAPVSTISFILLPLTFVSAFFSSPIRRLLGLALAYTVFWFFGYQIVRYLVPALPFYCLAAAAGVDWLLSRVLKGRGRNGLAQLDTPLVMAAVCAAMLVPSWYFSARRVYGGGPIPASIEDRHRYLTVKLPSFPAYQFLNSQIGNDYRLYALDNVQMAYFADGTFMGDWYGEARYSRITSKMNSSEALSEELRRLGASHLLINFDVEKSKLPKDAFFQRQFRQIFSGNNTEVYEISRE